MFLFNWTFGLSDVIYEKKKSKRLEFEMFPDYTRIWFKRCRFKKKSTVYVPVWSQVRAVQDEALPVREAAALHLELRPPAVRHQVLQARAAAALPRRQGEAAAVSWFPQRLREISHERLGFSNFHMMDDW